jgi:chorismate synthase
MAGNTTGKLLQLTSFGESHGVAIGGVLDGLPSGIRIDFEEVARQMNRRRPGQSKLTTSRNEADEIEWLSGIFEGVTTGTPLAFLIRNKDQRSRDYSKIKDVYRPGHADWVYDQKYGFRDYRGGGRSSARETAVRVAAGTIAGMVIPDIQVFAYVSSVGDIDASVEHTQVDPSEIDSNEVRTAHADDAEKMSALIAELKQSGDSVGGMITCVVKGAPAGLGEPVYDKLSARLASAMMSINASKGFEIGNGFEAARIKGSENNDTYNSDGIPASNRSGGIVGGISNGLDIVFRVAFKPVSTIMKPQQTIDQSGRVVEHTNTGRHDPCVVPRAVPIVEAMTKLILADFYLIQKTRKDT